MPDLGLLHIPEMVQRGDFFRECPEGNRKNYRKLQTVPLPQMSPCCGLSLQQQSTTSEEFVVVAEDAGCCHKAQRQPPHQPCICLGEQSPVLVRGAPCSEHAALSASAQLSAVYPAHTWGPSEGPVTTVENYLS